jgi:endoglucanase
MGARSRGDAYTAKSGTVTFAPGETRKTISIVVRGDRTTEANETFFVNLSGGAGSWIEDGQGVGTILSDDRFW